MSWWQLRSIDQENFETMRQEKHSPPSACPNDGEPLLTDPRTGKLRCPYDGWREQ